jgi:hypothetical protein
MPQLPSRLRPFGFLLALEKEEKVRKVPRERTKFCYEFVEPRRSTRLQESSNVVEEPAKKRAKRS